jgi:hypothetical protein
MSTIASIVAHAYPSPVAENGQMVMLYVLCQRIEGTFKVYAGIVPDNSINDPKYLKSREWVQRHGAPLRYAEAARLFDIKDLEYAS